MKIIFLDVDGVISHAYSGYNIDPEKVELLQRIIDETGAKIVVSSSWRKHNVEKTIESLGDWSFVKDIVGVTPRYNVQDCDDESYWSVPRGMEIKMWLLHNEVDNYVILDDEDDMLISQIKNFVQTDTYTGLDEEGVRHAIQILNGNGN